LQKDLRKHIGPVDPKCAALDKLAEHCLEIMGIADEPRIEHWCQDPNRDQLGRSFVATASDGRGEGLLSAMRDAAWHVPNRERLYGMFHKVLKVAPKHDFKLFLCEIGTSAQAFLGRLCLIPNIEVMPEEANER
jgi:hypothetical protein